MSEPEKWEYKLALERLAEAVRGFRNLPRLGRRKHRKLRRSHEYSELCRTWEEAADLLDGRRLNNEGDEDAR